MTCDATGEESTMSAFYDELTPEIIKFVEAQPMFFTATAPTTGRINLSPKGMDTFRVLDQHTVAWLDLTGSGNETATHIRENGRITLMFCGFGAEAKIVRLYGAGRVIRPHHAEFETLRPRFPEYPGVRQIMLVTIASAMTSCGYGVPRMDLVKERDTLAAYWAKRSDDAVPRYWREHNIFSIDGLESGILDDAAAGPTDPPTHFATASEPSVAPRRASRGRH
jgi:hypothetical protein